MQAEAVVVVKVLQCNFKNKKLKIIKTACKMSGFLLAVIKKAEDFNLPLFDINLFICYG